MTDKLETSGWLNATKVGIAVSLSLHLLFLILDVKSPVTSGQVGEMVELDLTGPVSVAYDDGGDAVNLYEHPVVRPSRRHESQLQQRRREAYGRYIEAVSDAVHGHRLDAGDTSLIGYARIGFDIDDKGRFYNIRVVKSSGDSVLDQSAMQAVALSSMQIKRPAILGKDALSIYLEVRYQYALK